MRKLGFDFRFIHRDSENKIINDSGFLPNHMTDDGIEEMYAVYFQGAAGPDSGFEIGLNTQSLVQSSSFADLLEVTGDGYARKAVPRSAVGFPTLALDNGDMEITTHSVTFENTGTAEWSGAVDGFLNSNDSVNGNTLVCYRPLSTTRTLFPGDTLEVTIKVKGQQPV